MKKPFLLGFSGKAHSGKDFSADFLIKSYPELKIVKVGFADAVRDMVRPIFDVDAIYRKGNKEDPIDGFGVSLREILQTLGTDWGRHMIKKDFWVKILNNRILEKYMDCDVVIVSDIRFDNERDYIIDNGGILIDIIADSDKHSASKFSGHLSEFGVGIYDSENIIRLNNDFSEGYLSSLKETFDFIWHQNNE